MSYPSIPTIHSRKQQQLRPKTMTANSISFEELRNSKENEKRSWHIYLLTNVCSGDLKPDQPLLVVLYHTSYTMYEHMCNMYMHLHFLFQSWFYCCLLLIDAIQHITHSNGILIVHAITCMNITSFINFEQLPKYRILIIVKICYKTLLILNNTRDNQFKSIVII